MTFGWQEAPDGDFAVIGDPISHSKSPQMHEAAYRELGLSYRYFAIQVPSGEVTSALDKLREQGYLGVNVTVPHKEEALTWAQNVEPLALAVRAANTFRLSDRSCINTDAPGFLDTLEELELTNKKVLVLGAGGTARAISYALIHKGYDIQLFNRTRSRAVSLANDLGLPTSDVIETADPSGTGLIVNTTSASLNSHALPILWDRAANDAVAYDMMYANPVTPFLASASQYGLRTVDGLGMLAAQGARSFEWWLGIKAPRLAMLEAIR